MRSEPSEDLLARALTHLDKAPITSAKPRALVMGRHVEPWAAALGSRGCEVTTRSDLEFLPFSDASMDIVVAVDALEHTEWDRWALQQAHRVLRDGGRLMTVVPNLAGVGVPSDLAFLGSRLMRELGQRARVARGRPPSRLPFAGRRYRLTSFVAMLESLGYFPLHASSHGGGWLAPLGAPAMIRRHHLVFAERGPSLFGLDPRRPFPEPATFRVRFEAERPSLVAGRDRWLGRHPEFRRDHSRALDPSAYRDQNVLVLAPHPDDDVIPCGGTLARLIAAGARVTVIHATDGSEAASLWHERGERRRTVRLEEAREVAKLMGFDGLEFWNQDNNAFRLHDGLVARLAETLARLDPRLILAPFVTDIHPDHVVLCQILAAALERNPLASTEVLGYQTWCLVPMSVHCVVTDQMSHLEQVISGYVTAMKVEDYVHFAQDHDYYTACTRGLPPSFAEAFFAVPAFEFGALLATGRDAHE